MQYLSVKSVAICIKGCVKFKLKLFFRFMFWILQTGQKMSILTKISNCLCQLESRLNEKIIVPFDREKNYQHCVNCAGRSVFQGNCLLRGKACVWLPLPKKLEPKYQLLRARSGHISLNKPNWLKCNNHFIFQNS